MPSPTKNDIRAICDEAFLRNIGDHALPYMLSLYSLPLDRNKGPVLRSEGLLKAAQHLAETVDKFHSYSAALERLDRIPEQTAEKNGKGLTGAYEEHLQLNRRPQSQLRPAEIARLEELTEDTVNASMTMLNLHQAKEAMGLALVKMGMPPQEMETQLRGFEFDVHRNLATGGMMLLAKRQENAQTIEDKSALGRTFAETVQSARSGQMAK